MINQDLFDPSAAIYIFGSLMNNPTMFRVDRYKLIVKDFPQGLFQIVYVAIHNLSSRSGVIKIHPEDIDLYLGQFDQQYAKFNQYDGLKFLREASLFNEFGDTGQFEIHYERLKKYTILRELEREGINTSSLFDQSDLLNIEQQRLKLDKQSCEDLIDFFRKKLMNIEKENVDTDGDFFQNAGEGLAEMIAELQITTDRGKTLEGKILNYVSKGCRPKTMLLYSAPTGAGKTRFMVGNACRLSLPRIEDGKVIIQKNLIPILYIATEQTVEEIQTLIVAYVSGVNEAKILGEEKTEEEKMLIQKAIQLIRDHGENFHIDVFPCPNMKTVKIRLEDIIDTKNIQALFYDYIFIPTDEDNKRGATQYRPDQVLMMFSNLFKEIAQRKEIFIMTGTQVSSDWEKKTVRNQNLIRDAKSISDKVDVGMIGVPVSDEEFSSVKELFVAKGLDRPNIVVDLYKNRRGRHAGIKIWRKFDLGTCRSEDLLVTKNGAFYPDGMRLVEHYEDQVTPIDILDYTIRSVGEKDE